MYIDQDSLGNDVEMFADNKPNCDECALAMGLPVNTPITAQEMFSEIKEKTDEEINIINTLSISVSPSKVELLPREFIQLNIDVQPDMANIPSLTWESSDISKAYVTSEGIVYAVSKGEVTITATNPEDNSITSKCTVSVVDTKTPVEPDNKLVQDIKLSQATKSMAKKETFTLDVTVVPEDATDPSVSWSSNSKNATVDSESGLITAVSTGTAKITATAKDGSGIHATCTITVKPTKVSGITVTPDTKSVEEGEENAFDLSVSVTPEEADDKSVTWSVTSGEEFASVDSNGRVTPIAEGEAVITATANDGSKVSGNCTVTITAKA